MVDQTRYVANMALLVTLLGTLVITLIFIVVMAGTFVNLTASLAELGAGPKAEPQPEAEKAAA